MWLYKKQETIPGYVGGQRWIIPEKTFVPAYLKLYEQDSSIFEERREKALKLLEECIVCPRDCRVNRLEDEHGICRSGRYANVSSAFPHHGEEAGLRGRNGSGTIFFSFCNLKCVFCQNHELSWQGQGTELDAGQLAGLMIDLQNSGCHNINFVTPEHVVPQLMEAIPIAVEKGLRVPLVYNTSAYDSMHSLELMDGIIDIYMPDFKFWDRENARRFMAAEDYPDVAREAVREMHRQVGPLRFSEKGIALRGLLIRHLVMPEQTAGSDEIFRFLSNEISKDTWVNIMDQYRPDGMVLRKPDKYAEISRGIYRSEYDRAVRSARSHGLYRFDNN